MNILVTGGRGFIGKRLVEVLSEKAYQADVLSRTQVDSVKPEDRSITFIQCNLLDSAFDFDDLVGRYDVIFNCAGELHNESLMHPLHVEATHRLVHACKKVAQNQTRSIHWVQLSSYVSKWGWQGISRWRTHTAFSKRGQGCLNYCARALRRIKKPVMSINCVNI